MNIRSDTVSFSSRAARNAPVVKLNDGSPLALPQRRYSYPATASDDTTKLLNSVFTLRDNFPADDPKKPADTTFIHCVEVLSKLPRNIPLPELDVDEDGYFEMEWYNGGKQFSLYITDSRRAAYAFYYNENDHGSGYARLDDLFDQRSLTGITRVFVGGSIEWLHRQVN